MNGCLTTDKNDYAPASVAVITGYGFTPNTEYNLIISTDGLSQTFSIKTDDKGSFTYSYTLYTQYHKLYTVQLKDLNGQVVATTTFTDTQDKVAICHGTGSNGNPYVGANADKTADAGGHDGHNGPIWFPGIAVPWGDIIPPFDYSGGHYPGKNWTTQGQAILNNECSVKGTMIVKKVMVSGTDSFTFTGDVAGTISSNNGTKIVNDVTPGTYSSVESAKSGWDLTSITCDDGQSANVSSGNTGTRTATFKVDAGETVTCTFTNTKQQGTIELKKAWSGTGGQTTLNIGTSNGGSQVDTQLTGANGTAPLTTGANSVNPGTYYVSETGGLTDYNSSLACTDNEQPITPGENNSVTVATNHTVICTFTNTRNTGTIIVDKQVDTNGDGTYEVTTNAGANALGFLWGLDAETPARAFGTSQAGVTTNVIHSVSENSVAGYHFVGSIISTDPSSCNGINPNPNNYPVPFLIPNPGNNTRHILLCNARDTGTIKVGKDVVPNDSGATGWDFAITGPTNNNVSNLHDGDQSSAFVSATGDYKVTETAHTGTNLGDYTTEFSCVDGQTPVISGTGTIMGRTFPLGIGQNIVCTFTNTIKRGSITVTKQTNPQGSQQSFAFNLGGTATDSSSLSDGQSHTFDNLLPGNYTLTELVPGGWDLTNAVCNERSYTNGGTLNLSPGGSISCSFTNTERGKVIVTKYLDDNANGKFDEGESVLSDWDMSLDESIQTTDQTGKTEFDNILPGSHTLSETTQNGWILSNIYCDNEAFTIDNSNDHTVNVPAGGTINCFVGNYQKAHITVIKDVVDPNGKEVTDSSTGFTFNMTGQDPFVLHDEDGGQLFNVKPGTYTITETPDPNYTFAGCTAVYGNQSVGITQDFGKIVTVNSSDTVTVTCVNKQKPGHVGGFKWNDLNGNGQVDCNNDGVCEPKLESWTIFVDLNGNGKLDEGEPSTTTDGNGNYSFDLNPGTYRICEVLKGGWQQTYPINADTNNCHTVTLGSNKTFDSQEKFGNKFIPPILQISKSNNATGDKSPGDSVIYTIVLTTLQNSVHNLTVTDLLPQGFKYHAGSASAVSSTKGVLSLPSQPSYASPGVWTFPAGYTLDPGEILTLTLTADIDGGETPGLYKDVTWAAGTTTGNPSSLKVLAAAQPEGFVSDNFVGTKVNVVKEIQKSENINITGQVLGASTSLPATGGKTIWVILASILTLFGVVFVAMGIFMRKKISGIKKLLGGLILFIGLTIVFIHPASAHAVAPKLSIRLEQPKSPTNQDNFNLIFVVLDNTGSGSPITVKCYKKGPSDGGYSQFGSDISVAAGGNTGNCPVNSSIVSANGTYQFYATATNGVDNASSADEGIVSVDFNTSGPGTPTDYYKTPQSCSYLIHFKTADDGGKTVKVEIYRSTNTSFTLDSGSRVQTISVGSNTNKDITDSLPDCNKTYYYAVRAFDSAGNASGYVGDSVITTVTTTTTPTAGAIPVSNVVLPGGGAGAVLGKKVGTESGVLGEATPSGKPEIINLEKQSGVQKLFNSVAQHKKRTLVILLIIVFGGGIVYYVFKKKDQPEE